MWHWEGYQYNQLPVFHTWIAQMARTVLSHPSAAFPLGSGMCGSSVSFKHTAAGEISFGSQLLRTDCLHRALMTSTTCTCHARSTISSHDAGTPREQHRQHIDSVKVINWFYPGFICQCWCGLSQPPTWAEFPWLLAGGSGTWLQMCLQLWPTLMLPVRLTMAVRRAGGTSHVFYILPCVWF